MTSQENQKNDENKKIRWAATVKAMDYLARRDHSELELRQKLSRRFESDIVEYAIEKCRQENWLSPPEEIAERVALSLDRKNKSYYYIQSYLRKKGLPSVRRNSDSEEAKAYHILAKYIGTDAEKQRLYTLLKNRGFDKDTCKKVIHEILRNS